MKHLDLYEALGSSNNWFFSVVSRGPENLKLIQDGIGFTLIAGNTDTLLYGLQVKQSRDNNKLSYWTKGLIMPWLILGKDYFVLSLNSEGGQPDNGEPYISVFPFYTLEEAKIFKRQADEIIEHSKKSFVGKFSNGLTLWYGDTSKGYRLKAGKIGTFWEETQDLIDLPDDFDEDHPEFGGEEEEHNDDEFFNRGLRHGHEDNYEI